ncbi:MAG: hypothetical protein H7Y42_00790 [Chitinophagaceae bacterium]|nr:hypothetical protein [Chitinophagaceae bacterium]
MKKIIFFFISGLLVYSSYGQTPTFTARTTAVKITNLAAINYSTLKLSDISTLYKDEPFKNRFAMLGKLKSRYKLIPLTSTSAKQGVAPNGLRYYIAKDNLQLPANTTGTTTTYGQDQSKNALICKSTPIQIAKQFAGPLFMGMLVSTNDTKVYPGALFRDDDVVKGIFTPINLPRTNGSIVINVLNTTGNVSQPVSNFNDKTVVFNAINDLRTTNANAAALAVHDAETFEVKSADEFAFNMETSANADLTELVGVPLNVGQTIGGGVSMSTEFNMAVATIRNVNYIISMGGEGPQSTISGAIPVNTVCVTDVAYGSVAYLMVFNAKTRAEATVVANTLVDVAEVVGAERNLSAEAKRLLEGGFVKIKIVGGVNATSTATITSIAKLREEMAKMQSTVGGINAMPLYYNLCYASDNASVKIGAFTDFTDTRCFKADKLDVTVLYAKPTAVVDFGDEELYGTINVDSRGVSTTNTQDFWKRGSTAFVAGKANQNISMDNQTITFNLNPALINFDEEIITMGINVKDKIMGGLDPESVGANATDRDRGFAQYSPTSFNTALRDIRDAPNQTLEKTFNVTENGASIQVRVRYKLYF